MKRENETEPLAELLGQLCGYWTTQAMGVAVELGVPDLIGDAPQPVAQLAAATQSDEDALYRVLRALAGAGVFREEARGVFEHTPKSRLLRSDAPGGAAPIARQIARYSWKYWTELLHTVRTGETAVHKLHGAELFPHLATHPEQAAVFDGAMSAHAAQLAAAVLAAHDFGHYRRVVDVGGGHGRLARAITARHPAVTATVFDRAPVVATRQPEERVDWVAGDFFEHVVPGADAYVLSWILHDWSDADALRILASCRRAMQPTSRLLVVEMVLPEGNEPSMGKWMDISMLLMTGGRERTEAEYTSLLGRGGFRLIARHPTAGAASILEAGPV